MIDSYRSKANESQSQIDLLQKKLNWFSILRLLVFVFSAVIVLIIANQRLLTLLLFVVPICLVSFGLVFNRYNRFAARLRRFELLKKINEQEISRTENKLSEFPTGESFLTRNHPYVADVDIFGQHSLFQMLNRGTTESGQFQLAEWLAEPASKNVILERQQSVKELTGKVDWRQSFQTAGIPFINTKSSYNDLLNWNEQPVKLLPNRRKYLVMSILLGVLATMAFGYFLLHILDVLRFRSSFSIMHLIPLAVILVVNKFVIKKFKPISQEIVESLYHSVDVLAGYEALIEEIESETFTADSLRELQSAFRRNGYRATTEISRLRRILDVFMHRGTIGPIGSNVFYTIINQFLLLDIYWILLTETWKNRNRTNLPSWSKAIGEFEALCSLSGFACSNPSFSFPQISNVPYVIDFTDLGHPLIHSEKRICNDFELQGNGSIVMITGSNMAGKSTFLRTVGVNLVLAFTGAPCCASRGNVSPMRLFTSMRTQDNLKEGVSSFYAELMRIEQLLALVESGKPVFFLLDEMFKGTNSQDRYKGGISLIKQLSELNSFGIISTHDIELAKTASNYVPVINLSFNSQIQDREMLFNHKLTKGLCSDFNASELMKKSGIKLITNV